MVELSVIIRKGEVFVRRWDKDIGDHVETLKREQVLSDVLQAKVTIEDTTFGQFFSLIGKERELYERIFRAALYGHPLEPFVRECDLPARESSDLDFTKVYWRTEISDGDLSIDAAFGGWGDWPDGERKRNGVKEWLPHDSPVPPPKPKEKGGIGLEFSPLQEYKAKMLKLETKADVSELSRREPVLTATMVFTVYDVINAILSEITWAGDITHGRGDPFVNG